MTGLAWMWCAAFCTMALLHRRLWRRYYLARRDRRLAETARELFEVAAHKAGVRWAIEHDFENDAVAVHVIVDGDLRASIRSSKDDPVPGPVTTEVH